MPMKILAVTLILGFATCALAADAPAGGARGLFTMICIQEGVGKGLRDKDLEAFVGKCVQAREAGANREDTMEPPEMANC